MNRTREAVEAITETQVTVEVAVDPEEEKQTILHCRLPSVFFSMIRIHPTTFLIEQDGSRRQLLSALDISVAPEWGPGNFRGGYMYFTLVFEGLGKACDCFHMEEFAAPTENLLFKTDIVKRNQTDVYHVNIISE